MVKEDEHVVKHTVMGLSMGGVGIRSRAWGRGHAQHGRGSARGAWEEDECRNAMMVMMMMRRRRRRRSESQKRSKKRSYQQ